MNMRYGEIKILCWAVLSFFLFSCEKDETAYSDDKSENTIYVFAVVF